MRAIKSRCVTTRARLGVHVAVVPPTGPDPVSLDAFVGIFGRADERVSDRPARSRVQ